MDQGASGSTVSVDERMDRFELRVGDRRLNQGLKVSAIGEVAKIIQQLGHQLKAVS